MIPPRSMASWRSGDRGAIAVEVLFIVPAIFVVIMLLAWAGRGPSAVGETMGAANAAARAAALAPSPGEAVTAAASTSVTLSMCESLSFDVDTSRWDQGWVSVEVTCVPVTVGLEGLNTGGPIVRRSIEQIPQWGTRG